MAVYVLHKGEHVEEEYELLPHEEIAKLREEVEALKKNPVGNQGKAKDLVTSIENLTDAVYHLTHILQQADTEMLEEYKKGRLQDNFNKISDQNEKIAQALLAINEKISPQQPAPGQQARQPQNRQLGQQPTMQPNQQPPNMQAGQAPPPMPDLPPLDTPPPHEEKKGIMGLFK